MLLEPGVYLTIPLGTYFQFKAAPTEPVAAIAITMPPWPGESEAVLVQGPWVAASDWDRARDGAQAQALNDGVA